MPTNLATIITWDRTQLSSFLYPPKAYSKAQNLNNFLPATLYNRKIKDSIQRRREMVHIPSLKSNKPTSLSFNCKDYPRLHAQVLYLTRKATRSTEFTEYEEAIDPNSTKKHTVGWDDPRYAIGRLKP